MKFQAMVTVLDDAILKKDVEDWGGLVIVSPPAAAVWGMLDEDDEDDDMTRRGRVRDGEGGKKSEREKKGGVRASRRRCRRWVQQRARPLQLLHRNAVTPAWHCDRRRHARRRRWA